MEGQPPTPAAVSTPSRADPGAHHPHGHLCWRAHSLSSFLSEQQDPQLHGGQGCLLHLAGRLQVIVCGNPVQATLTQLSSPASRPRPKFQLAPSFLLAPLLPIVFVHLEEEGTKQVRPAPGSEFLTFTSLRGQGSLRDALCGRKRGSMESSLAGDLIINPDLGRSRLLTPPHGFFLLQPEGDNHLLGTLLGGPPNRVKGQEGTPLEPTP